MTCTDFEVKISAGEFDAPVVAHLGTCASCRAHADSVKALEGLAALPELSGEERVALARVSAGTREQLRRADRRRAFARRVISFAVAAGLGAVIASGVAWKLAAPVTPLTQPDPNLPSWELSAVAEADSSTTEDENLFEVSWPSLNEGEIQ